MLNIGEFARAGGVSVRMLRHYDQLGLLTPAEVDLWNGRRRYDLSQLGKLHRIVTLKELGFTLVQVANLLADGVGAGELREMLRWRRTGLLTQVNEVRHRLAQLDARLRLIESESEMIVNDEIVMKRAEPMRIAAVEGTDADGVEDLFIRAGELMDAARLPRLTPVGWFARDRGEPAVLRRVRRHRAGAGRPGGHRTSGVGGGVGCPSRRDAAQRCLRDVDAVG